MSDGNQSFKERNSKPNQGEELFKAYCERQGAIYYRLGFDEKKAIPDFYNLPPYLRHLPDYVVHNPKTGVTVVVEVKGSLNFKESDYQRLDKYDKHYGTELTPYLIAFSLPSGIIWTTAQQVKDAYEWSTAIGSWPDGVKYRTLTFDA
jgi:hypothetical protein